MSALQAQNQPPFNRRHPRLHWAVVAALWVLAIAWIAVDPLTGGHSDATSRWMQNVSLLLVAAACTALIGWLIQYLVINPSNSKERVFELGYQTGWHDAANQERPTLGIVEEFPTRNDEQDGRTGT